jgi:hypothetical protein
MRMAGDVDRPALLLPDGWPHSRPLYDGVLEVQSDQRTRSGTSAIRRRPFITSIGSRPAREHSRRLRRRGWSRNRGCPLTLSRSSERSSPYREFKSRTPLAMRRLAAVSSHSLGRAVFQEAPRQVCGLRCESLPVAASRVSRTARLFECSASRPEPKGAIGGTHHEPRSSDRHLDRLEHELAYEAIGYTILLPASAVPGWPADVVLPSDSVWKRDYSAAYDGSLATASIRR